MSSFYRFLPGRDCADDDDVVLAITVDVCSTSLLLELTTVVLEEVGTTTAVLLYETIELVGTDEWSVVGVNDSMVVVSLI